MFFNSELICLINLGEPQKQCYPDHTWKAPKVICLQWSCWKKLRFFWEALESEAENYGGYNV